MVQLVLDNASSLNLDTPLPCANNQGLTPLCVASLSNDTSGCQLLIKAGADVNRMDSVGRCALHWAVLANQLNTVKILLSNGAKIDLTDPKVKCLLSIQHSTSSIIITGSNSSPLCMQFGTCANCGSIVQRGTYY